jgi:hypothetical protein
MPAPNVDGESREILSAADKSAVFFFKKKQSKSRSKSKAWYENENSFFGPRGPFFDDGRDGRSDD